MKDTDLFVLVWLWREGLKADDCYCFLARAYE